ncbi:hypothetical protein CERZMDRAFT_122518 [Cercospora zeae-maydis SCOH1-5]|uniref:Uncharacterized protein n=1 Tax=Cercospora zeae-maydis SCOH1-5 TaxID=717836 RepID=A0A6A6F637_9PEZI|nr:hypothetical protein CERZMDRAFT_122518 [Cercospora zeae-maydis SCOH1-5]
MRKRQEIDWRLHLTTFNNDIPHFWMNRPESCILARRLDLFARLGVRSFGGQEAEEGSKRSVVQKQRRNSNDTAAAE